MTSASLAGCSILICEDEPLIALDIAEAFSNAGARVMTVRSLADALTSLEDEVSSAVILDHSLSDGDSSQLRECLKERNIPYVVHSGYGGTGCIGCQSCKRAETCIARTPRDHGG